jgi:hypothetical protein
MLYTQERDEKRPEVYMDECPKQLIGETNRLNRDRRPVMIRNR